MPRKFQGLRWDAYNSENPTDVVRYVSLDTDRQHTPYWVVQDIPPINAFSNRHRIIAVHDRPKALHVELPLMGGMVVACWDRKVIETFWTLGVPLMVFGTTTAFISDRMQLKKRPTLGYPCLYEVTHLPWHGDK